VVLLQLQGRTCSMKRAIIPEQPLPPSLDHLRQRLALQSQHGAAAASLVAGSAGDAGPVAHVGSGDYVAVLVTHLAGTGTLLSTPLARTSTAEFVRVFGTSTPSHTDVPGWLAAATGPLLAAADWQQVAEQQQQDEAVAM
jgi:hypothetical protein